MTGSQLRATVDKLLTNVAIGYFPAGFIAHILFADLKVKQKTGKLGKYGKHHLRIVNAVMGGKGLAPQIDTKAYETDSYEIVNHGLHDVVTPDDYDNVEEPFDAEADTTRALELNLMLGEEKGLADALTDTATITQNATLAGTDQFSDKANSDPLGVVGEMKKEVVNGCGMQMDTIVADYLVALELMYHPQIFDRLGFKFQGGTGPLSVDQLANAFQVKRFLIGDTAYVSTNQGQATQTLSRVWGKHLVGLVAPTTPMIGQVSAGYRISRNRDQRAKVYKSPVNNPPESNMVLVTNNYDYALVQPEAVSLRKNVIA